MDIIKDLEEFAHIVPAYDLVDLGPADVLDNKVGQVLGIRDAVISALNRATGALPAQMPG